MFNLYDNPAVSDWFRRFDAASRHLPAEERVSQREEIQQHLVGLVAANMALGQPNEEAWKAALKQFGDPTQIGRRIDQEWQQGRTGPSADKDAIRYAAGHIGCYFAYFLIPYALRDICLDGSKDLIGFAPLPTAVYLIYAFGGAIPVGVLIGRNRPLQAVRAAFYASLVWACQLGFSLVMCIPNIRTAFPHTYSVGIVHLFLLMPVWLLAQTVIAYLASVTRRGWYTPSLADFKLTLPRRRPQISR